MPDVTATLQQILANHGVKTTATRDGWLNSKSLYSACRAIWNDNFVALLHDGCGNYFTLDAYSPDSDRMVLVAHDPYGIEDLTDGAQELFCGYLPKTMRKSKKP